MMQHPYYMPMASPTMIMQQPQMNAVEVDPSDDEEEDSEEHEQDGILALFKNTHNVNDVEDSGATVVKQPTTQMVGNSSS